MTDHMKKNAEDHCKVLAEKAAAQRAFDGYANAGQPVPRDVFDRLARAMDEHDYQCYARDELVKDIGGIPDID